MRITYTDLKGRKQKFNTADILGRARKKNLPEHCDCCVVERAVDKLEQSWKQSRAVDSELADTLCKYVQPLMLIQPVSNSFANTVALGLKVGLEAIITLAVPVAMFYGMSSFFLSTAALGAMGGPVAVLLVLTLMLLMIATVASPFIVGGLIHYFKERSNQELHAKRLQPEEVAKCYEKLNALLSPGRAKKVTTAITPQDVPVSNETSSALPSSSVSSGSGFLITGSNSPRLSDLLLANSSVLHGFSSVASSVVADIAEATVGKRFSR